MFKLTQKHTRKIQIYFLIWLLAGGIGFYLRLYPLRHFVSSDASEQASMVVINAIRNSVDTAVAKANPALPANKLRVLQQKEFDAGVRNQQQKIRDSIYQTAKRIDEDNPFGQKYPYLLASDSYYYYGLTDTILKTGRLTDKIKGSKFYHPLMLAPLGYWEPLNLHPYAGLFTHKLLTSFSPKTPLMYSVSYTDMLLALLCLIPFLVICAFFRCLGWSSLVGSVYFMLAPIFLKRSCFGWYDDDPYNIFFPLLILAIIFYGFRKATTTKHFLLFAGTAVVAMVSYAFFWHGWVFFESVLLISGVLLVAFNRFVLGEKKNTKNLLIFTATILFGVLLGISLVFGPEQFFVLFQEGWTALNNFLNPQVSLWPDMYITVGELKRTPWNEFVGLLGGYFVLMTAALGLVTRSMIALRKKNHADSFAIIILLVFLFCITFMALEAQRFVLMSIIPFSLFFVLGIESIFTFIRWIMNKKFAKDRHFPLKLNLTLAVIAIELILLPCKNREQGFPLLLNQIYNSTWDRALSQIKLKTPTDSIVNTWWPPGHFIKAVAQRRVTFDGASIDKPQAYWLANAYLTNDERQAAGLLRMLNNSANQATEYLQGLGLKLSDSVAILKAIATQNPQAAARHLDEFKLTPQQIQSLLALTHRQPPATYLLIYNDLVEKSLQLTFVADWNFKKAEDIRADARMRSAVKKLNPANYVDYLWKMSGGRPPRESDPLRLMASTPEGMLFEGGIKISRAKECAIQSPQFGNGVPISLVYLDNGGVVEKTYPNPTLSYSVVLISENNTATCFLMEQKIASSLLTKLFYFEGKGLKYFHPFVRESDLTRRTKILVYRIDWERFDQDIENLTGNSQ